MVPRPRLQKPKYTHADVVELENWAIWAEQRIKDLESKVEEHYDFGDEIDNDPSFNMSNG